MNFSKKNNFRISKTFNVIFPCSVFAITYFLGEISSVDDQFSADEPFSADEKISADEQISSDELIFGFGFRPSVRPSGPKFSVLVRFSVGKISNFGRIRSPDMDRLSGTAKA